jgi:hypothetical protein
LPSIIVSTETTVPAPRLRPCSDYLSLEPASVTTTPNKTMKFDLEGVACNSVDWLVERHLAPEFPSDEFTVIINMT